MNATIIAGAAALALTLGTGIANAAAVGSGGTPGYQQHWQQLQTEPGYNIGTGAAAVGDGSNPGYFGTQRELQSAPGYSVNGGAARVSGTEW